MICIKTRLRLFKKTGMTTITRAKREPMAFGLGLSQTRAFSFNSVVAQDDCAHQFSATAGSTEV